MLHGCRQGSATRWELDGRGCSRSAPADPPVFAAAALGTALAVRQSIAVAALRVPRRRLRKPRPLLPLGLLLLLPLLGGLLPRLRPLLLLFLARSFLLHVLWGLRRDMLTLQTLLLLLLALALALALQLLLLLLLVVHVRAFAPLLLRLLRNAFALRSRSFHLRASRLRTHGREQLLPAAAAPVLCASAVLAAKALGPQPVLLALH